ncbi:MAG: DUF1501 domain-containing protein, partial [Acidobacteria bacterium]|nr:DUF1501 domain-containing protein [Acidobacteriota bacterium]
MDLKRFRQIQTRRSFFTECAGGIGVTALWHLLALDGLAASPQKGLPDINPLKLRPPHFTPKAKNVIFLFMAGAPSQLDLFDPKPEMARWDGQPLPESLRKGLKLAFIKSTAKVWASPRVFTPHGESGLELSDWLPHLATCADDLCMIRSIYTEQFNHHPGQLMMNCGSPLVGQPSMGAWVTYGLGSMNRDLPGYVVLVSGGSDPT